MKRITITTLLFALLTVTMQAQSVKLGHPNVKTQRLFIAKNVVNLGSSDFATVAVAANCDYSVTSDEDWLTIRKMANGNAALFAQTNYNLTGREAKVTFASADETIKRTLTVTQEGYEIGDDLVPIASAKASQSQSGEGIDCSFDGNLNTLYHSPYSGTSFPVTLTYNLTKASHIDYVLYTPRQDNNTNGNFERVTIEYQVNGTWTKLGDFNFGGSSSPVAIDFGENGMDDITAVRFTVRSGTGGWASCAEMQFFQRGDFMANIKALFADDLFTKLKDGVTREQIEQLPTKEFRDLALALLDGNYSTEFRIGEFGPRIPKGELANLLKTDYQYNFHENPTGINFKAGEVAIIMVEGVGADGIQLQVRNFGPKEEDFVTNRYGLRNGMNIIKMNAKGNGYIDYYTSNWKKAPKVKIHFVNAVENGYFSPSEKGHTNADWKRLLKNAKGDCFDLHGKYVDCVFPLSNIKAKCPNDGETLMRQYDEVVRLEHELMGIHKFEYEFPNHMAVTTVFKSAGYMHAGSNDNCCVPVSVVNDALGFGNNFPTWAIAHELGHVNQMRGFSWPGLREVTNNLLAAYVQHSFDPTGFHRLENEGKRFRYYRYLDKGVRPGLTWLPSVEKDVFATLIPLYQLLVYTRFAEIQPDAYLEFFETLRKGNIPSGSGPMQVNFMKQFCHITKTNYLKFFETVGMLKEIDQHVADYTGAQLTITKSMINNLKNEIEKAGYPEAPAALHFIDVWNYPIFRDQLPLEGNTVGKGCSKSGENVRIQHSQWKNVVGFETYNAEGKLLHITNYGRGEDGTTANYTNCEWIASEKPAYIMAVGFDGTRIKCYEP